MNGVAMVRLIVSRPDGTFFTHVVDSVMFNVGSKVVGVEEVGLVATGNSKAESAPTVVSFEVEHSQPLTQVAGELQEPQGLITPGVPSASAGRELWILEDQHGKPVPCTNKEGEVDVVIACTSQAEAERVVEYQRLFDIVCVPRRVV